MSQSDSKFGDILKICKKYDETHVYKSCFDNDDKKRYFVILKKLEDTETTESRHKIANKNRAYFRASKLLVVEIMDFNDLDAKKNKIICKYDTRWTKDDMSNEKEYEIYTKYEVNELVEPHHYNKNVRKIHAGGIHYFKRPLPALFYGINISDYTGEYMEWYENGRKYKKCNYVNGRLSGRYNQWHDNGKPSLDCNYVDLSGDKRGNKNIECGVGILTGKYTMYWRNGTLSLTCNYVNGILSGEYVKWTKIQGQPGLQCNYVNGKRAGDLVIWDRVGGLVLGYRRRVIHEGDGDYGVDWCECDHLDDDSGDDF